MIWVIAVVVAAGLFAIFYFLVLKPRALGREMEEGVRNLVRYAISRKDEKEIAFSWSCRIIFRRHKWRIVPYSIFKLEVRGLQSVISPEFTLENIESIVNDYLFDFLDSHPGNFAVQPYLSA